jgi:drug/metabolite transporter (DMT)-like permease
VTVSTVAILLVLGCSLAFSMADLLRKVLGASIRPVPLLLALSAGMAPAFFLWFLQQGAPMPSGRYWLPGLGSGALNVAANLLFLEAVRRSPLSSTIPFLSLTPVFTTLLAIPTLGELPQPRQWLGIAGVVVGACWLNLGDGPPAPRRAWRALGQEVGSRLMVAVALLWSLAMPLDKIALSWSSPAFHGLVLNLVVAGALLVISGVRGTTDRFRELARRPGLVVVCVLLSLAALSLQLLAIRVVWVGFVETMKRGLGSVLALVWGRLVFGEAFAARRVAAVLLMGLGVALIVI